MTTVSETIRLTSPLAFGSSAPPDAVGAVLRETAAAVRQAIAMSLTGRSMPVGRPPRWLLAASDIRFRGISGEGGTTLLHFEAPRLGESAEDLYAQSELWPTRPPAETTGFDLLRGTIRDVRADNGDSDRFDLSLLRRIMRFERAFDRTFETMTVCGGGEDCDSSAVIDGVTIKTAHDLSSKTPKPQAVRVVGKLDMIRDSSRTFALHLDDGQEIRGVFGEGEMSDLAPLFRRRVLVLGKAVYRPSGRLLRIDAERLFPGESEPSLWSRIPAPIDRPVSRQEFRQQRTTKGVEAFFGTWPGQESDEELLASLEALG